MTNLACLLVLVGSSEGSGARHPGALLASGHVHSDSGQLVSGPFGRYEVRYWDGRQWTHHVTSRGRQAIDPPSPGASVPAADPANWYPDPFGRYEVRYWDGRQWTHHVTSRGSQAIDPPVGVSPAQPLLPANKKVQQQVAIIGVTDAAQVGVGPLLTEPVLVVNQKAKLFEVKAEYAVFDQNGRQIGLVRQVGENFLKKALAPLPDDNRTRRLQVLDMNGHVLMVVTRPAKLVKSTVTVTRADGTLIGQIVQKNLGIIGKIRLQIESGGRTLGSINAEDWHAWDFNIQDKAGNEIARITKTWAGLTKELFTKSDNYVVQVHRPQEEPLRSLVVAGALVIDTVLRQDSSGSTRRR